MRSMRWWLFAALALVGCGEDGTPGEPRPVIETVVITNAPTSPLATGATVQLIATAISASGGSIPNATFTWGTSHPAIAAVSPAGLVSGVSPGVVSVTATSGGKSAAVQVDVRAIATIPAAGGVFTFLGGKLRLEVPAGGREFTVLLRPVPDPGPNPRVVPGTVFELAPDNLPLPGGTTLTLQYDPARIPSGLVEESLQLSRWQGGAWAQLQGSGRAGATPATTGYIFASGTYAVRSTPVDRVELRDGPSEPVAYVGQALTWRAVAYNAFGDSLGGWPVAWSSSSPTVASAASGRVTALAPGTTTISATVDGKSASTTVTVLARPAADWTKATAWVSYQGDSLHTGYVDATVDPGALAVRWTRTLEPGIALNAFVEGSGLVYTSALFDGYPQRAWALDPATGTTAWGKLLGNIHGVHPPAYNNDVVYMTTSGYQDSYLYAFDARTGIQRFRSAYPNEYSRYLAPVVIANRVYMAGGPPFGVYSFEGVNGTQRWVVGTNSRNNQTPAVRGGLVHAYAGLDDPKVIVVDAQTGQVRYEIPDPDYLFFGSPSGDAVVLGTQSDLLATQAGRLVSFDLAGRRVRYAVNERFNGQVTVAPGVIYAINDGALDVRREDTGEALWTLRLSDPIEGAMVATRNILFVRTYFRTWAIDLAVRRPVWSIAASGPLTVTATGQLLIAGRDGVVTAIALR